MKTDRSNRIIDADKIEQFFIAESWTKIEIDTYAYLCSYDWLQPPNIVGKWLSLGKGIGGMNVYFSDEDDAVAYGLIWL